MVNSRSFHPESRSPLLVLPWSATWRRLAARTRLVAFWAFAGGLLPALNVAVLVSLVDTTGLGLAVATVLVGDLAFLVLAAMVTDVRGAGGRTAGGLALAVLVTWVVLVVAFLLGLY